jgi:hypothetical protein
MLLLLFWLFFLFLFLKSNHKVMKSDALFSKNSIIQTKTERHHRFLLRHYVTGAASGGGLGGLSPPLFMWIIRINARKNAFESNHRKQIFKTKNVAVEIGFV